MTTIEKLERIKNYRTRYELVATNIITEQCVLVGYTPRKGRDGLFDMLHKNGEAWVAFSGAEDIRFGHRVADGATSGDWRLRFSGRTQRDAIIEGELPFFARDEDQQ